jgi:predicted component of type VI protein secretion system
MPYIVVNSDHQDVDCRELDGPLVIGRAPECQVSVRDILLSRRHCRIEKSPQGWLLIDLGSKNGTVINGERLIAPRLLNNNDVVRMGRSQLAFHTGTPGEAELRRPESPRPIDPHEALAGTISGFTFVKPDESEPELPSNMPCPQPKPKEPEVYQREELHEMLTAIASSSWDSIYAEARLPKVKSEAPAAETSRRRPKRPRSPIDFSLQASSAPIDEPEIVKPRADIGPIGIKIMPPPPQRRPAPIPQPQPAWRGTLRFTAAALWIVAGFVLMAHSPAMRPTPARAVVLPATPMLVAAAPMTISRIPSPAATRPSVLVFSDARKWNAAARAMEISLPNLFW